MRKEPAASLVFYLGGPLKVASIVGLTRQAVARWYSAEGKSGTGGQVPSRHQQALMRWANANKIDLRPVDFFTPKRLTAKRRKRARRSHSLNIN